MEFWERLEVELDRHGLTRKAIAADLDIPAGTIGSWKNRRNYPTADVIVKVAKALGTTVEYLITGEGQEETAAAPPQCIDPDPNIYAVPILNQKVAAGRGQEILESAEVVGTLPFLKRMLRGADPSRARALEVRGDSMTGVEIFDGDLVVFVPGSIRGDGIYVLRVNDSLIVKRVEFDEISQKLRIMSENPRYPDRIESADGQAVEVVGKVYGWVHAHPY
jgi:SOS-response transcriptional repressor LexA